MKTKIKREPKTPITLNLVRHFQRHLMVGKTNLLVTYTGLDKDKISRPSNCILGSPFLTIIFVLNSILRSFIGLNLKQFL